MKSVEKILTNVFDKPLEKLTERERKVVFHYVKDWANLTSKQRKTKALEADKIRSTKERIQVERRARHTRPLTEIEKAEYEAAFVVFDEVGELLEKRERIESKRKSYAPLEVEAANRLIAQIDEKVGPLYQSIGLGADGKTLSDETKSNEGIRYEVLASRTELIEVFSCYGVELKIFKALKDRPGLKAACRVKGKGQKGSRAEPMFCPFEVINWLVKTGVKEKPRLENYMGWHILETKFPSVYAEKSIGDPRQN